MKSNINENIHVDNTKTTVEVLLVNGIIINNEDGKDCMSVQQLNSVAMFMGNLQCIIEFTWRRSRVRSIARPTCPVGTVEHL